MGACSAFGCSNRTFSTKRKPSKHMKAGVSFHRFPKNPKLKAAWLRALRRVKFVPGPDYRVCSDHFSEDCFLEEVNGRKCLKKDAVPRIFPAFPAHLQKKPPRKPPKVREFIPPKSWSTSAPKDKAQDPKNAPMDEAAQDPENMFVAHRNLSASACTNGVSAKPTPKLPPSADSSNSVLELSSGSDQNLEETLEPDFNPADYIFPVDVECVLGSAPPSPTCDTPKSPVALSAPSSAEVIPPSSVEVLAVVPLAEASFETSTPTHEHNYSQKVPMVARNPVRDFAATILSEFASSESCRNCNLYKEANMLLGNELEGKEQTISYLQEEIIRLNKQLEACSRKKINVRIMKLNVNDTKS